MNSRFESVFVPLSVAIGGAIGAVLRWELAGAIVGDGFPWATFLANVSGSLALGAVLVVGEVIGRASHAKQWHRLWRPFMATGVLGGFTTFSTFVLELNRIDAGVALLYLLGSVGFGLFAFAAGNALARRVFGVRS